MLSKNTKTRNIWEHYMLAPKPQENHACEYQDHESTMPCEHQDRSTTPLCSVRITAVLHDVMSVVMPLSELSGWLDIIT